MAQRPIPSVRPTRRQVLGLGGAGVAAAALAACGGNTGRSASGSSSAGTISQWYHQYGETGTQQAVERYAAAYKKAKVSVQWIPGNYDQKAAAALLTSSGPDVFEYGNGPTIDMITGKQVVDVTDLLGTARSDFTSSLLDRMTYQGTLYGIPQVVDMQLFLYRKSMLKKAGVQPPKTLDELLSAAKKLTVGKVKGLFLGNDGGAGVVGGPVLWSSGHDYLSAQDKPDFNNAEVIGALSQLHALFTSGHLLLGAPADWSDPSAFIQGLTAIQWTGLWVLPQVQKALGDDFGVLPFPGIKGGPPSVPVGAYASCVSARAHDVTAAKDFAKWLWVDQTSDQLDFAQSYGFHVPARKSLIARASKLKTGEAAKAARYLDSYGHPQTPLMWTPTSSSAFNDAVDKIIRAGADPRSTLTGVQGTVESELQRFTVS
ncbi:ABC transporter substrate-binding protein [Leekyejoonella antrihumi]|uniref:Sugar ABC transporter substrate-binding protein n=1 Tax=Leekyejoonella antrihumi TaxID=1660198 RepID=A0A563DYY7_9MICO|nr:sugar ABC transporter substrate-binding protein [Leekyejoonella antrihumi]TWP35173.1 sugar ABC transporter substrate-binding protein [Leekyejoonella antrihumi]